VRLGDLSQRQHLATPCIGKQHVKMTCLLLDLGIQIVQVCKAGGIAAHTGRAAADRFHGRVELSLSTPCDEYHRTFFCECLGGCQADTGRAAGHQCDLAFEFSAHVVLYE
jgi:hypothetical protein